MKYLNAQAKVKVVQKRHQTARAKIKIVEDNYKTADAEIKVFEEISDSSSFNQNV